MLGQCDAMIRSLVVSHLYLSPTRRDNGVAACNRLLNIAWRAYQFPFVRDEIERLAHREGPLQLSLQDLLDVVGQARPADA